MDSLEKMKYAVTICLLSVFISSVASGKTMMGNGRVTMEGSIIETACAIELNSRDQIIEMDETPVSKIIRDGRSTSKPFVIKLINCTLQRVNHSLPAWKAFRVTFDGTHDGNLIGVEGNARGVGLQIKDLEGNTAFPGVPMPPAELRTGDIVLHYTMYLVPNHRDLQAGEYRSTVRFKMDYY